MSINSSQNVLLTDVNIAVGGLPLEGDQSEQTIPVQVQVSHALGTIMGPFRVQFD